jgi:hypothetical protein
VPARYEKGKSRDFEPGCVEFCEAAAATVAEEVITSP